MDAVLRSDEQLGLGIPENRLFQLRHELERALVPIGNTNQDLADKLVLVGLDTVRVVTQSLQPALAQCYLGGEGTAGHGVAHAIEVLQNVVAIATSEIGEQTPVPSWETVVSGCLVHDLSRVADDKKHALRSAKLAKKVFERAGWANANAAALYGLAHHDVEVKEIDPGIYDRWEAAKFIRDADSYAAHRNAWRRQVHCCKAMGAGLLAPEGSGGETGWHDKYLCYRDRPVDKRVTYCREGKGPGDMLDFVLRTWFVFGAPKWFMTRTARSWVVREDWQPHAQELCDQIRGSISEFPDGTSADVEIVLDVVRSVAEKLNPCLWSRRDFVPTTSRQKIRPLAAR